MVRSMEEHEDGEPNKVCSGYLRMYIAFAYEEFGIMQKFGSDPIQRP